MAPQAGLDAGIIKDSARKDLLNLLEGVRLPSRLIDPPSFADAGILWLGPRKEEFGPGESSSWAD